MKELNKDFVELGMSFTKNKIKVFKKIIFPQLYPFFFSSFKDATSVAWKVILIGEIFAATSGIGFMMQVAREFFDVSSILAYNFIIIAIILAFSKIFDYIDKKYVRKYHD